MFLDHANTKQPGRGARSVHDRFAVLHGLRKRASGVIAEQLRFDPNHSYTNSFLWNLQNNPSHYGLSINAHTNRFSRKPDGTILVEGIDEAFSCDLVDNPGATERLLEQTAPRRPRTVADVKNDLFGDSTELSRFEVAMRGCRAMQLRGEPLVNPRAASKRILAELLS